MAAAFAVTGAALGNPMVLLMAIQTHLRNKSSENDEASVRTAGQREEAASARRVEELERAEKMAKKAAKRAPPWVKKLIGAVLSAVGSIASIAGGAGLALVAVGAALIVGAKLVEKLLMHLAEKGLIDEKRAGIASAVVKIAAAVAAAVTGQVGSLANAAKAAMDVASTAVKVVKSVVDMVQAAADVAFAGVDMHTSARTYQSQMATIMAEQWGIEAEGAIDDMNKAADCIQDAYESHGRMVRTATATLEREKQGRMAATQAIA
ncbi:MAG: hypothetical protein JJ863_29455 [Deltaproteobacteria bacterium]|nr:hypothetical protein [Deltaproteobacteria bacterium]